MGGQFSGSICELFFCEKSPFGCDLFSFGPKRTKMGHLNCAVSGFWEFDVQLKAKKLGWPQIPAQSCGFLCPPFFDWGAVFAKMSQFFL